VFCLVTYLTMQGSTRRWTWPVSKSQSLVSRPPAKNSSLKVLRKPKLTELCDAFLEREVHARGRAGLGRWAGWRPVR
jgi:hypothetical protein